MGRAKGKRKKQSIIASHDDSGSGKEENIPTLKQRGRPKKQLKNETREDEKPNEKMEEDGKILISSNDENNQVVVENGKKRKSLDKAKENFDTVKESKSSTDDSMKSIGFRQVGSRRKNKPRRAAEAVVECWFFNNVMMLAVFLSNRELVLVPATPRF
ncbi:hypothetical protein ACFE04_002403 [Oxalis oulophora]